jgi:hypothetical protein
MGEGAPFASAAIALPFTSEGPWEHGCFEPDHPAKTSCPLPGLPSASNEPIHGASKSSCPHHYGGLNESIMLHRYEHGLILYCDSDPYLNSLTRNGACTILSSYSWFPSPCRSTTHVCRDSALPSSRTHLASRFRICTVLHRAVHTVSLQK